MVNNYEPNRNPRYKRLAQQMGDGGGGFGHWDRDKSEVFNASSFKAKSICIPSSLAKKSILVEHQHHEERPWAMGETSSESCEMTIGGISEISKSSMNMTSETSEMVEKSASKGVDDDVVRRRNTRQCSGDVARRINCEEGCEAGEEIIRRRTF